MSLGQMSYGLRPSAARTRKDCAVELDSGGAIHWDRDSAEFQLPGAELPSTDGGNVSGPAGLGTDPL